ncbi:MAG: GntR family transcriptional regulator [Treponema sp.]|jgi:GntR family transcriptional regulator|nr:GntR family transcriptional regulator [Treponema sp.]
MQAIALDRKKGAAPLYYQIENLLRQKIEDGEFEKGDIFLSERELMELFEVSRITVRQAIRSLVQAGYLQSSRGIGTTVVAQKIMEDLHHKVISFSEEMALHGIVMNTSFCKINLVPADLVIARDFGLESHARVYLLERIRCADKVPIVYTLTYLNPVLDLPLDGEEYKDSLYRMLAEKLNIRIVSGQEILEAIPADINIAAMLEIEKNMPVFKRTRITMDQHGRTIEHSICYYPGNKYKYAIKI